MIPDAQIHLLLHQLAARLTVQPNGCWTANAAPGEYPMVQIRGRSIPGHRLMFLLTHGPVPPDHVVDHDCHNRDQMCPGGDECAHRRCWRPDHLRAATNRENINAALPGGPPVAADWVSTYDVARALGYIPADADAAAARRAVERTGSDIWRACGVRSREFPRGLRLGRRMGYYVPTLPQYVIDAVHQAKSTP